MNTYQSSLVGRGASPEMSYIWSDNNKFKLWRKLWAKLAETQKELGLGIISDEQVEELNKALKLPINIESANEFESKIHHDVMAHIKAFGEQVPSAKGIIHLGATSQFVVDNADRMRIKESIGIILSKLIRLIVTIGEMAYKYRDSPALGYTHYQPAQLTTVGKRAASWAYDLILVMEDLEFKASRLKTRGAKGATGTQASYLQLFGGDYDKVRALDEAISNSVGGMLPYLITGQTYPRIDDSLLMCSVAGLAAVCQKIATDIRLLSHDKEIMEGFGKEQVGSSAMPYKKNPIKCERVCGLAKFVIGIASTNLTIAAEQWLERSLDDSSPRRIVIPEAFLATDAILESMTLIFRDLVINFPIISQHIVASATQLILEKVLMVAVERGADRQEFHEILRKHSTQYSGDELLKRLAQIPELSGINLEAECCKINAAGCASKQVEEFYGIISDLKASHMELFDSSD